MKLCYILPKLNRSNAENFFHIRNFLSELGKFIDVHLIVENSDEKKPIIQNIQSITILSYNNNKSLLKRSLRLIWAFFKLQKSGVRLFFGRSSLTGTFPVALINRLVNFNKSRVLFWSCGQDIVPISYKPSIENFKRIFLKILFRLNIKLINYLVTGPEEMVNYYSSFYNIKPLKIINLPNDISLQRFFPLDAASKLDLKKKLFNSDKKIILYVHTFNLSRGANILPIIAKNIVDRKIDALVIAIGRPGDYSKELDKQISILKLEERLINIGQVPNKDIMKYYQVSDLFIMPSLGEGFPRVVIESMATGCPVVSYDVGGVKSILPQEYLNRQLISVGDQNAFIESALCLVQDNDLLSKISNVSLKKVNNFSTEKVAQKYFRVLASL